MAYNKEVAFVLFVCSCFLGWASATNCTDRYDCQSNELCCLDKVCRQICQNCFCFGNTCCSSYSNYKCRMKQEGEKCYFCAADHQCGPGRCCLPIGICKTKCSDGVCREKCDSCSYNSQCGPGECCSKSDKCNKPCADDVCRETCGACSNSLQCGFRECCTPSGKCKEPCTDSVCRETCYHCSNSSQCGPGECCNWNGHCKLDCSTPSTDITGGFIAGIVVIFCLVVAAIVVSIVAYFYWECCPCYRRHLRRRHRGQFVQGVQPMGVTTTTVATQQNIQHPPRTGYNSPPASGYTQLTDQD